MHRPPRFITAGGQPVQMDQWFKEDNDWGKVISHQLEVCTKKNRIYPHFYNSKLRGQLQTFLIWDAATVL